MALSNSLILAFLCYSIAISGATLYVSQCIRDSYLSAIAFPFFQEIIFSQSIKVWQNANIIEFLNLSNPDILHKQKELSRTKFSPFPMKITDYQLYEATSKINLMWSKLT
jgi:hypothetical protein